jgi:hypothetical protein
MVDTLTITAILFATILLIILSVSIIVFGNIISKTPDMLDRHGKRKEPTDAPYRHAKLFVYSFWIVHDIGICLVLLSGNSRLVIIGGVMTFSGILFAATILAFEMKIIKLMKSNQRNLAGSLVA